MARPSTSRNVRKNRRCTTSWKRCARASSVEPGVPARTATVASASARTRVRRPGDGRPRARGGPRRPDSGAGGRRVVGLVLGFVALDHFVDGLLPVVVFAHVLLELRLLLARLGI